MRILQDSLSIWLCSLVMCRPQTPYVTRAYIHAVCINMAMMDGRTLVVIIGHWWVVLHTGWAKRMLFPSKVVNIEQQVHIEHTCSFLGINTLSVVWVEIWLWRTAIRNTIHMNIHNINQFMIHESHPMWCQQYEVFRFHTWVVVDVCETRNVSINDVCFNMAVMDWRTINKHLLDKCFGHKYSLTNSQIALNHPPPPFCGGAPFKSKYYSGFCKKSNPWQGKGFELGEKMKN